MSQGGYLLLFALLSSLAIVLVIRSWRPGARGGERFRAAKVLGAVLGWFVGGCLRIRRAHVEDSMARCGVEPRHARAMYRRLGQGVFELLWLSLPGRRRLDDVAQLDPELARWLADPRGVVVATAHTGNWDLTACAAAQLLDARGRKLMVVTKHFSHGWLDRLWQGVRRKYGVELVSAGSVWRRARRELPRGNAVAMMLDQAPERRKGSARGHFLGRTCALDLAPCLVAGRLGVPLIAVFGSRGADGRQFLRLAGSISPPAPGEPLKAWAEASAQTLNDWLSLHVHTEPADWLWMHRRWKDVGRGAGAQVQPLVSSGNAEGSSA